MTQLQEQIERVLTTEDFLQLPESNTPVEFINGEVIVSPSPQTRHQHAVLHLAALLMNNAVKGRVLIAPMDLKLDDNVLQPDVFWIRADGDCVNHDTYWKGAPDFVADVLSPSMAKRDRAEKFRIYERAGVREYGLIDPDAKFIEVYSRDDTGKFQRQGVYGTDETFTSTVFEGTFSAGEVIADA